jgi:hypothetical protein
VVSWADLTQHGLQLMPKCLSNANDDALLHRLLRLLRTEQNGYGEPARDPEVTMQLLRQHSDMLHLLWHVWLQCDSHLAAGTAAGRRRFAVAQSLLADLQRVAARDSRTTPIPASSALACPYAPLLLIDGELTCTHAFSIVWSCCFVSALALYASASTQSIQF